MNTINTEEYSRLYKEHGAFTEQLLQLGVGQSITERLLSLSCVNKQIEEQKKIDEDALKELCIDIVARYLILLKFHQRLFDYTTENQVCRALWNNGIDDIPLKYWCSIPREAWFEDAPPRFLMPAKLKQRIQEVVSAYPSMIESGKIKLDDL
jgi:hypothetical protein